MKFSTFAFVFLMMTASFSLTACGGGGNGDGSSPSGPACSLTVTPSGTISLSAGQGQAFTITSSCGLDNVQANYQGFAGISHDNLSCTSTSCAYTFSNDTAFQTGTITFSANGASDVVVMVQITP